MPPKLEDHTGIVQAAGHAGTVVEDSVEGFVLKPFDEEEAKNYECLWNTTEEPLQPFIAKWGGTTQIEVGSKESGTTEPFMRLGNLLERFKKPCVMDCKMGCRTFQEKEGKSKKPRPDLYKRLVEEFYRGDMCNEAEHANESITKFKWTTCRDAMSTSPVLGFRVDGIVTEEGPRLAKDKIAKLTNQEEVLQALPFLLPLHNSADGSVDKRLTLIQQILTRLTSMRGAMENSPFFTTHEFVGASLLFICDSNQANIFFIDLAKTEILPEGISVDHRKPWVMGNHEDGMLLGMDTIITCWEKTLRWLTGKEEHPVESVFSYAPDVGLASLRDLLKKYDVDAKRWETEGKHTLEELYSEIYLEKTVSIEESEDGYLCRVLDVVKAWIIVDNGRGEKRVLVEPKVGADGKASGGKLKPFQRKMKSCQQWDETLRTALEERLRVTHEWQQAHLKLLKRTYRLKVESDLGTVDHGFVGLWTKYRVHEVDIEIMNPNSADVKMMGLPEALDFKTVEASEHSAFGYRSHSWKWAPLSQTQHVARSSKAPAAFWGCGYQQQDDDHEVDLERKGWFCCNDPRPGNSAQ